MWVCRVMATFRSSKYCALIPRAKSVALHLVCINNTDFKVLMYFFWQCSLRTCDCKRMIDLYFSRKDLLWTHILKKFMMVAAAWCSLNCLSCSLFLRTFLHHFCTETMALHFSLYSWVSLLTINFLLYSLWIWVMTRLVIRNCLRHFQPLKAAWIMAAEFLALRKACLWV